MSLGSRTRLQTAAVSVKVQATGVDRDGGSGWADATEDALTIPPRFALRSCPRDAATGLPIMARPADRSGRPAVADFLFSWWLLSASRRSSSDRPCDFHCEIRRDTRPTAALNAISCRRRFLFCAGCPISYPGLTATY